MTKPIAPKDRATIQSILASRSAHDGTLLGSWKAKLAAGAAGGLAILVVMWAFSGSGKSVGYVTAAATRGALTVIVTATGSVQPTKKVDVSSELSGTVRTVLVDYNSLVKAGQLLAELDTDKLKATVASSRARLAATKAKVADAEATVLEKQRDLARKRLLADKKVVSAQDLDLAQASHDRAIAARASAEADVGVSEADLKLNETNLAKASIASPINGVVLKRNVDPGQTVASSLQAPILFAIAEDLSQMELQVDVDEADVGKVRAGQNATFTVDAFPDRKFPAAIRDVRYASETIQGVVTYKAVLTIDNAELLLRPGMTATAEIRVTEIADALLVPNAALRYSPPSTAAPARQRSFLQQILPGRPPFREASKREETSTSRTVWILRGGTPEAVAITIGPSDGRRTQVIDGKLQPDQQLVIDQTTTKS